MLPIDWPVGPQNTDVVLDACRPHPELVPFASVHPMRRDVDAHLERHRAAGAKGVKVHPAVQGIPPDHPRTVHLCGRCGAHGLPVGVQILAGTLQEPTMFRVAATLERSMS